MTNTRDGSIGTPEESSRLLASLDRVAAAIESVGAGDRSFREAAASRAVRITELINEAESLHKKLEEKDRDLAKAKRDAQSARASFARAEARIRMLERERLRAEHITQKYENLRRRKSVRLGLKLAEPAIAIRKAWRPSKTRKESN